MPRIAYVQENHQGQPYSANGAVAAKGFELLGFAVRYFRPEGLSHLPLAADAVVVGGMGVVRKALDHIGVGPPSHASIPAILKPFAGRDCWRATLGQIRDAGQFPIFIKPYEDAKTFNGQVFQSVADLNHLLVHRPGFPLLSEDAQVLAQEPVIFLSEWRVFVVRRVVVGISFYRGDPLIFPAAATIRLAIAAYDQAPAGYSADFGIVPDGRTLLIETNDGYSLGHGGLTATLYAELLLARWDEMTRL